MSHSHLDLRLGSTTSLQSTVASTSQAAPARPLSAVLCGAVGIHELLRSKFRSWRAAPRRPAPFGPRSTEPLHAHVSQLSTLFRSRSTLTSRASSLSVSRAPLGVSYICLRLRHLLPLLLPSSVTVRTHVPSTELGAPAKPSATVFRRADLASRPILTAGPLEDSRGVRALAAARRSIGTIGGQRHRTR